MIELLLRTGADSRRERVILTFPASRWDVLDTMARLGVDSLAVCSVAFRVPNDVPKVEGILDSMEKDQRFFDELNYFARRLSEMSHNDRILLDGAISIHGPEDMKTLINLTWHLDNIVIGDAGSDEELGRFLINNGQVDFAENIIPYLHFSKVGHQHRAENSCAYNRGMYFEDLNPDIDEVYDGCTLPEPQKREHIFRVTISGYVPEHSIDLLLPASENELSEAMDDLNASYQSDIYVINAESTISRLNNVVRPFDQCAEDLNFADLNELAHIITAMDNDSYIKFLAILEVEQVLAPQDALENCSSLDEVMECAIPLDEYDFDPGITAADIGSYGFIRCVGREQEMVQATEPQQKKAFEMGEMSL